jgi:hypothetical protein
MAQTQMVLRPATPGQLMAEGGNPSATEIGTAIRWLDKGANSQAMQAISRAARPTRGDMTASQRSGCGRTRGELAAC